MLKSDLHPVVAYHINTRPNSLGRVYAFGLVAVLVLWSLGAVFDKLSARMVEQQRAIHQTERFNHVAL